MHRPEDHRRALNRSSRGSDNLPAFCCTYLQVQETAREVRHFEQTYETLSKALIVTIVITLLIFKSKDSVFRFIF